MRVVNIDKGVCRLLVMSYHYSGRMPGIVRSWGLVESSGGPDRVVGCIIYSMPASYTLCRGVCGKQFADRVLELSRLVVITPTKNAASYLIGESLRRLGRERDAIVVSYADCNDHVGHVGYVYQATNWLYTGQGTAEPKWLDPKTGEVVSFTRRHIDVKARALGYEWTDLVKEKQIGKHRYLTFVGTRRFKRQARAALRYETFSYPKGPSRRHNEGAK